jgi:Polyketide cyclase / dehydrase and lipid transport
MAEPISVSIDINAPAEQIYALVSDLPSMGKWSPEATGGKWLGGATEATRGARFRGTNRNGFFRWSTVCTITAAEPGREIEWVTKAVGLLTGALWSYDLKPNGSGGTTVTESTEDRRGFLLRVTAPVTVGVKDRAAHNRKSMQTTLERLKTAAESGPPGL